MTEKIVRMAAGNFAEFYARTAAAQGKRTAKFGELVVSDLESPAPIINGSVFVGPGREQDVREATRFYAEAAGGGFIVWSRDKEPDLRGLGFAGPFAEPVLAVPAGRLSPAPLPPGLEIAEVSDETTIAAFEYALIEGTPIKQLQPARPGAIWLPAVLETEGLHAFVGMCEGRPAVSAVSMRAFELNGIYAVATLPEFRRRGFAEALTLRAVLAAPALPAVLEASPQGRSLYERMGFEYAGDLFSWEMAAR